jgi:hypothetical protein
LKDKNAEAYSDCIPDEEDLRVHNPRDFFLGPKLPEISENGKNEKREKSNNSDDKSEDNSNQGFLHNLIKMPLKKDSVRIINEINDQGFLHNLIKMPLKKDSVRIINEINEYIE